jgi:hypothetical protein
MKNLLWISLRQHGYAFIPLLSLISIGGLFIGEGVRYGLRWNEAEHLILPEHASEIAVTAFQPIDSGGNERQTIVAHYSVSPQQAYEQFHHALQAQGWRLKEEEAYRIGYYRWYYLTVSSPLFGKKAYALSFLGQPDLAHTTTISIEIYR